MRVINVLNRMSVDTSGKDMVAFFLKGEWNWFQSKGFREMNNEGDIG